MTASALTQAADGASSRIAVAPGRRVHDVSAETPCETAHKQLPRMALDDSPHLAKDLDIRLLTILPGGGRTEPEYARLLAEAGFHPKPAACLARIESVIAATPAS